MELETIYSDPASRRTIQLMISATIGPSTEPIIVRHFGLAIKAKALDAEVRNQIASIVTPDTLLRWFRHLVAKKCDGIPFDKLRAFRKGGPGRPRLRDRLADLVLKMAEENLSWGYLGLWIADWGGKATCETE